METESSSDGTQRGSGLDNRLLPIGYIAELVTAHELTYCWIRFLDQVFGPTHIYRVSKYTPKLTNMPMFVRR